MHTPHRAAPPPQPPLPPPPQLPPLPPVLSATTAGSPSLLAGEEEVHRQAQCHTCSLVFRSTEDADDVPERVLVDADKRLGVGRADAGAAAAAHEAAAARGEGGRYPPSHPLAWLNEQPAGPPPSEERRAS